MYLADRIWQWLWDTHGLERRTGQIELAQELRKTLHHHQPSIGLYECPTGVGKSLAMLIEGLAVARDTAQPVWIATPRRDLQAQLMRDATLVSAAISALELPNLKISKLQGIEHTLCHLLTSHQAPPLQHEITAWLQVYPDGDLDHLSPSIPRAAVSMSASGCHGETCPFSASCLSRQPRVHIPEQDLVITNHALIASTIRRPFLPAPTTLIVDEGHLLDRAIRQTLTFSVSLHEIERHATAFLRALPASTKVRIVKAKNTLTDLLAQIRHVHIGLTDQMNPKPNSVLPLFGYNIKVHPLWSKTQSHALQLLQSLTNVLKTFPALELDAQVPAVKLDIARQELGNAEQNLKAFCEGHYDQYFLTRTDSRSIGFLRIPDSIHRYTRKRLWEPLNRAILLSGTLATSNSDPFSAIRGVLGIPGDPLNSRQLIPSDRTIFERVFPLTWTPQFHINLVPQSFPSIFLSQQSEPLEEEVQYHEDEVCINPDWIIAAGRMILQQDHVQPHGIVVLSTSYTMQKAMIAHIQHTLMRPLIIQESGQMQLAIQQYLASGPRSIFFSVAGWAGMDLPNLYLQDLFILKLPLQAKAKTAVPSMLEQTITLACGRDPRDSMDKKQYYNHIIRPAIIMNRQALGRVIRRPNDSGTVWYTDRRLADPGQQSLYFGGVSRRYLYSSTTIDILPTLITTEAA